VRLSDSVRNAVSLRFVEERGKVWWACLEQRLEAAAHLLDERSEVGPRRTSHAPQVVQVPEPHAEQLSEGLEALEGVAPAAAAAAATAAAAAAAAVWFEDGPVPRPTTGESAATQRQQVGQHER